MDSKQYNFEVNDFVRLNSLGWRRYKEKSIVNENAFQIKDIITNGYRLEEFEDTVIPSGFVEPIPIDGESDSCIYYDPIIAASFINSGETPPEHEVSNDYYMESFKKSYYSDGRTLYEVFNQKEYQYVHEIQQKLRYEFGFDELKINHSYKPVLQVYINDIWGLRKDFIDNNVPSHLFIYELSILMYIKYVCDKGVEMNFPYRWEQLELGAGKLELYHQDALRMGEYSNLISEYVLKKTMAIIDKIDSNYFGDIIVALIQKENQNHNSVMSQYSSSYNVLKTAVEVLEPKDGEKWDDPAAGTCGTMVELSDYMKKKSGNLSLSGCEIYSSATWIGKCNLLFHNIKCNLQHCNVFDRVQKKYDGIICDLPLGYTKMEGRKTFPVKTDNRQLNFILEICTSLKDSETSRAAFTLPDSFFLQRTVDVVNVKKYIFSNFNVPIILKLPADSTRSSVNMSLVFLTKSSAPSDILIYDARNKSNRLSSKTNNDDRLKNFVDSVRDYQKPSDNSPKKTGWTSLSLQDIIASGYSFDINEDLSKKVLNPKKALSEAVNLSKEVTKELEELIKTIGNDK